MCGDSPMRPPSWQVQLRLPRSPAPQALVWQVAATKKARHGGGPVFLWNELTVRLLRGCALRHNLSGVLRQFLGLGQLVERGDYLRIVFRPHSQAFFLAKL